MSEEAKERTLKMTPEQQAKMQKEYLKRQATDLVTYKKRLRDGNELKKMQVEELELNIRYYNAKRAWFDIRGKVEELDAEEQVILAEERNRRGEMEKLRTEELLKANEAEKAAKIKAEDRPEIIIPKVGKARAE